MIKKFTYLKTFIAASALMAGLSGYAQKSVHLDFENVSDIAADWTNEAPEKGTLSIVDGKGVSGSKALAVDLIASGNVVHAYSNLAADQVDVADGDNVYIISSVATSNTTVGQPQVSFRCDAWGGPTPGFGFLSGVANDEFTTKSFGRNPNGNYNTKFSPRIRSKANGGACVIYYDNMVLYAHSSTSVDLDAPESATNLVVAGKDLTWTVGSDELTGIDKTVILRAAISASDLTLMNQANYAVGTSVNGWEVVAVEDGTATSYTDATAVDGTEYKYAVVHKDLAYNYSAPLVSGTVTAIDVSSIAKFTCYGVHGGIELKDLTIGEELEIFNVSGVKVVGQTIADSYLSVALTQGMYIVKVSGVTAKVVVK